MLAAHGLRIPQRTSRRLQLVRSRRKVAEFSSAAVSASDRFRGTLCLRDSQSEPQFAIADTIRDSLRCHQDRFFEQVSFPGCGIVARPKAPLAGHRL